MTQKELLYVEDAISHEENVIAYLSDSVGRIKDESIIEFFEKELVHHNKVKKDLLNYLKECSND